MAHALCHCSDCRRHAGAPVVGWTMYPEEALRITRGAGA
ncbi:MAG: GFA family protein [Alphaproteobacteria bacterium]